ncbi:MAG: alpha/beta hydrolase [Sarcina sp.]
MQNSINSYWGVELTPNFTDNQSDVLAIILPGIAYTLDRGNLEYSTELALSLNYDVLKIEYGFQIARKEFDVPKEFDILCKETLEEVKPFLKNKYKKIVIIAKSIGTCVQKYLNNNIKEFKITNVAISPIDKTVDMGIDKQTLVITGSSDPLLSKENKELLLKTNKCFVCFENANHALNISGKPLESLKVLTELIENIDSYLKSNV